MEWKKVVEAIKKVRPRAASLVEQSRPESLDQGKLTLRLPPGWEFQRTQLEGSLRPLLEKAVLETFGQSLLLNYVVPTMEETQEQPVARQAMDDPGVRKLLDSFGGDVVSVKDTPKPESEQGSES